MECAIDSPLIDLVSSPIGKVIVWRDPAVTVII